MPRADVVYRRTPTALRLRERYRRSVDLERDFERSDRLAGYVLTPTAAEAFARILRGVQPDSMHRAWSLVGSFGSGKSSLALFLAAALDYAEDEGLDPEHRNRLVELAPHARELWGDGPGRRHEENALLPVLIVGDRQPLGPKILRKLYRAGADLWPRKKPNEYNQLRQVIDRIDEDGWIPPAAEVADLVARTCAKIRATATEARGILLIVDEFGKHLEYSALQPERDDPYLLQLLAEAAARSGEAPLVLVTVQHQSLEAYASSTSEAQLNEWRKVQGRFEQINFQESAEQMFALMSRAIYQPDEPVSAAEQRSVIEDGAERFENAFATIDRASLTRMLEGLIPVHPVTAVMLPALFRRIGQQERSLFAFVASDEPGGLNHFIQNYPDADWYRPHDLHDYVAANYAGSMLTGANSKRWAELETAIARRGVSPEEALVLKTVGLLGLLGELSDLRADGETVDFSLRGRVDDVEAVLGRLVERRTLVWRSFSQSYSVWEGSDVDVEARLRAATAELSATHVRALESYLPARGVVARRHSIERGTLRYFDVVYAECLADVRGTLERESDADGVIVLLIRQPGAPTGEVEEAVVAAAREDRRPVLLGVLDEPVAVQDVLAQIERLRWVRKNTPALAGDAAARRELEARLREAEDRLRQALGGGRAGDAIRAFAANARWYQGGGSVRIESERELNERLTILCDTVYHRTPEIVNEICNRRSISSTAARAQRVLLNAMVERRQEERLGIKGAPPELSLYYSLLKRPGLHLETAPGTGVFVYRDLRLHEAEEWRALGEAWDECLAGRHGERVSVGDVVARWKARPFGLKDGILPILVAQVLLSREDDLALYEDDVFVPEVTGPILERLAKKPESFAVRSITGSGLGGELFGELARLFSAAVGEMAESSAGADGSAESEGQEPPLLRVVRPLVQFVAGLPEYTRASKELSPQATALRDTVLRARDPIQLLMTDVPAAVGADPAQSVEEFVSSLRRVLRELQQHYERRALDEIYETVVRAVGGNLASDDPRRDVVLRAHALQPHVTDLRLRGFLMRLADENLLRNPWCESVATVVAHKPPSKWRDHDLQAFGTEVATLGRRMQAAEAAIFPEIGGEPAGEAFRAHLSLTVAAGGERSQVVRLTGADLNRADRASAALREWLRANVGEDANLQLATIARAYEALVPEVEQ